MAILIRRGVLVPAATVFVPCAGTAVHMGSTNDLTNVSFWTSNNLTKNFNATDPNLVANNATDLVTSSISGGALSTEVHGTGANIFTLQVSQGTYAFGAYFKSIAGPPWILFRATDNTTHGFGAFFNLATATAGSFSNAGNGVTTCATAGPAGNGYTQVSFAGHVITADVPNSVVQIVLLDGDGTLNPTLNQEIYAYQVSP